MLFTITYTGENATDLGYLLHKNPSRPQTASLNFGKVHVFYPEASAERCTAALLLDMDPLDLARGRPGSSAQGLFDYVNDRPYVSSSFMSTAISRVYGTAMAGRCEKKQALADAPLDLSASLAMLPCRGGTAMLEKVFAPLGYALSWEEYPLDERFGEWGMASYVNVSLRRKQRLCDLLRHIYVLIPVFDYQKHYWMGEEEVDKLLSHGEGWLENHPEKEYITRRYFTRLHRYYQAALERMDNSESGTPSDDSSDGIALNGDVAEDEAEIAPRLNDQRLAAVVSELKACGAKSVIDMGCGAGNLLRLLANDNYFTALAGCDVSPSVLNRAAQQLKADAKSRITLFQSSLCYRDQRIKGFDAAVIMEVIEHIDESRLPSLCSVVFGDAAPKTVIITTPNIEYNVLYEGYSGQNPQAASDTASNAERRFRHRDHRFEWSRAEFRAWANAVAAQYGYSVRIEGIGTPEVERGSPTQMAVFTKIESSTAEMDVQIESSTVEMEAQHED